MQGATSVRGRFWALGLLNLCHLPLLGIVIVQSVYVACSYLYKELKPAPGSCRSVIVPLYHE